MTFLVWRVPGAGLFPIIDACAQLEKLDLTSCRGVKVVDRRRFFEVCSTLTIFSRLLDRAKMIFIAGLGKGMEGIVIRLSMSRLLPMM